VIRPRTAAAAVAFVMIPAVAGYIAYRANAPAPAAAMPVAGAMAVDTGTLLGAQRPEFSLPDLGGVMHDIGEWDGRVLVLNFWATWCPPCREEIPQFVRLQRQYRERGLQFIGIALQPGDEVGGFVQELGMNYPVLAGEQEVVDIAQAYGNHVGALPYTVVIGRDGRVRRLHMGPIKGAELERLITPLL
jgi:peroxiredoxin